MHLVLLFIALAPCVFAQRPASLAWSRYITGDKSDAAQAVAVDKDGDIWVAGSSSSVFEFPGPNDPFQSQPKGGADVFLAKFHPEPEGRATLLFWTWIGGTGNEEVSAIALDSRGRVYLTGTTDSLDFPTVGNPLQASNGGEIDAFVTIVDPGFTGIHSLAFSSYYGATKSEYPKALAVEPGGEVVVVGYTTGDDLPGINGLQVNNRGAWEAFFIRIDPSAASPLLYASYFGGRSTDVATGVAVDKDGIIWFSGYTASDDFPITGNAYRQTPVSPIDGFLVGIDPKKPGLDAHYYGSYFGGGNRDIPQSLQLDSSGGVWIAGYTASTDLPVTDGACQRESGGAVDSFIMRLDPSKSGDEALAYSSYFGGTGYDVQSAMATLPDGRLAIAGYSMFGQLPTAGPPLQDSPRSQLADGFLAVINSKVAGGACLEYSTYLGGLYNDVAAALAVDAAGSVYVAGYTTSADLPVTDGSTRQNPPILTSGFVSKFTR